MLSQKEDELEAGTDNSYDEEEDDEEDLGDAIFEPDDDVGEYDLNYRRVEYKGAHKFTKFG